MKPCIPIGTAVMILGVLMPRAMLARAQNPGNVALGDTGDFDDGDTGGFDLGDTGDFDDGDTGDFDDGDTGDFDDGDTGDFDDGDTGDSDDGNTGDLDDGDTGDFDDGDLSSCPATREASQNMSPPAGKQYGCSTNNGHLYESSDGHHFYMQCCTNIPTVTPIFGQWATDFGACMDACAQEPSGRCRSVGFDSNPSAGDTENCVLYEVGGFLTVDHVKYHYAFLAEPPTADHPDDDIKLCTTECPGSNNQVYTTPYGKTMRMVCGKRHGVQAVIEQVESWEDCMDLCGKLVPCQSVDYHRRKKRCYLGDHAGEPTIDAPGFSAAYNMGCAGACCGYPKSTASGPSTPLILPPGDPCPDLHDIELTVGNEKWQIKCTHVAGHNEYAMSSAGSLEECIQNCQNEGSTCVWAWFIPSSGYCGAFRDDYSLSPLIHDRQAQGHFNLKRV